ncbi:MAG: hypothetical protein L3J92_00115 [Thermoplasmata archaeon]|jgi:hypothetical protein|nr:hypothetical protein [Thermoplasmata archaeon]
MIEATARVLKNVIELRVGNEEWTARPAGADDAGIGRRIAALFSTEYLTYRGSDPGVVHSTVSYHAKNDEIRIQLGGNLVKTTSTAFGPLGLNYGGVQFTINERLTGRFTILRDDSPVGIGQLGFRSCTLKEYPPELEIIFANLAIGYVIRTLTWEMFG